MRDLFIINNNNLFYHINQIKKTIEIKYSNQDTFNLYLLIAYNISILKFEFEFKLTKLNNIIIKL